MWWSLFLLLDAVTAPRAPLPAGGFAKVQELKRVDFGEAASAEGSRSPTFDPETGKLRELKQPRFDD
jgi:hypothetical protein